MSADKPSMGIFQFGITIVTLVLAFLVGRFTATGAEHQPPPPPGLGGPPGPGGPIRPDSPDLVQKVEQIFTDGIKDSRWTEDEDFKFREALLKLGRDGQLKQLATWVQAVNSGKLKLAEPDAPPAQPACCNQCTTAPRGSNQGAASTKKSSPAAK
jgi:hypothetical protein